MENIWVDVHVGQKDMHTCIEFDNNLIIFLIQMLEGLKNQMGPATQSALSTKNIKFSKQKWKPFSLCLCK